MTYTNYSDACGSQDGFTFGGNDGSSEATMPGLLEVFPNPGEKQLSIVIPSTDLGTALQIVNMAGEVLVHRQVDKGVRSFDIDISGMPPGIYLVKCVQGKDQYTSKFVKQ
ncbi:T9SS type A sorting domain-containing protein [Phaeodactylibacter xiamenensis]|uniref:T9SS type A sorting domain-containing protein n=1 Tax=Phaeodactylibacter xiamenensis TaxID=1524460 RepID=UPI0024A88478|nr:T9SS type A sorting domain-containing protein [Phaeodactylibacter xiamenensis]